MALLKLSSLVSYIRGSIGGLTFSHDKSGTHLHKKVSKLKRLSFAQAEVRAAYSASAKLWSDNKNDSAFVNSWSNFADYPETGFNAFIRINWFHFFNGVEPLLVPPG